MNISLEKREIPKDIHKFTKKEESELFPRRGSSCIAFIDGDFELLCFDFKYSSSKRIEGSDEYIRDGRGETVWTNDNYFIEISNYDKAPFKEYWVIKEED